MAAARATPAQLLVDPEKDRRVAVLETALLVLLAGLAAWKGLVPGWRTLSTDFPNYYVAARLMRSGYCLDRLYDWIWFQRIADKFGINHQLVGFLGLTPFSALPAMPLSWLSVLEAKRAWLICNVALLAVAVHLLSGESRLSYRRAWLVALCAIIPLRTGFLFGQMHILVLALLVGAYLCHMRGRQLGSGCCIAIAAALKVYPVFFCIYFLVKRRWKALAAAIVGLGLCLIVSYIVAGRAAMSTYMLQQLPRSLQGESENPFLATLTSSSALFHRLFLYEPEFNPHPLTPSPALYALFYPLWQATLAGVVLCCMRRGFRGDDKEALEWSAFLCLLIFLSSAPASYQFVVLIAAAVPTVSILLRCQNWREIVVFLSLYLAACNLRTIGSQNPGILLPFLYLKLWSGVALIAFYCLILRSQFVDESAPAEKISMASALKLAAIVLCLWIPTAYGAWSHLRAMRIAKPILAVDRDTGYMRINPVATKSGLFYIAMEPDGYRVLSASGPGTVHDSDQLSFATTSSGQGIWVEPTRNGTTRLVRTSGTIGIANCQIDDAETPALSHDGSLLAFIREDRGHGSLWAIDVSHCDGDVNTAPVQVTPAAFDVRTVSTAMNRTFLISALHQGRERVFTAAPGESPRLLAEARAPLDSPALSPNGKLLAVRELIGHRWQLVLLSINSGRWKQLTHGDCNAYTPSWQDDRILLYATDCLRGLGLTTLASLELDSPQ